MSVEYDYVAASARFLGRMFPHPAQRQDAARMLQNDHDDYEATEVLGGLLQIDEARFNQSLVDSKRSDDSLYPLIDHLHFKDEIVGIAGRYIETPMLHSRPLSLFLLVTALDTELYPLKRDVRNPLEIMSRYTENPNVKLALFSQSQFGRGSNWIMRLLMLSLASAALFNEWYWIGSAITALLVWHLISSFLLKRHVRKASFVVQENMTASRRSLELVRSEIATGGFDADAMSQRIKRSEESGLFVPSVVYPLLQLSAPRRV